MSQNNHIVLDSKTQSLLCKECLGSKQIIFPIYPKELVVKSKLFANEHRRCQGRNCYSCKHLEWASGDVGDPEGFICLKRFETGNTEKEDDKLLRNLESHKYRRRQKICYERVEP